MVHQSCINLPRVIKITRHQHRLSHTPYIEDVTSPCRICYKTVDIKYGQYSCNQEDCSYIAHSKCATHKNVWDGKELEWKPDEYDESEDTIPFINVGDNLIKYFSHKHLLKLEKYDGVRDGDKQCQACVLPIHSRYFYNCMQCDFFLHEVCAGLLRRIDHALHVHPLVLDPYRYSPREYHNMMGCSVCSRKFSGFKYICSNKKCVLQERFQIDVRCTLVPDYFTHESHQHHPLFISTSYKGKNKICCEGCKKTICMQSYLQCSVCNFALCYKCATIPNEISYKYDKHPLSLCYGETADGMPYWCEVCEKEVDPRDWFYTCNECCITIHPRCVFGPSVYLMPGFIFDYNEYRPKPKPSSQVKVIGNSHNTRPLCDQCGQRCQSSVYYRSQSSTKVSCSLTCLKTLRVPPTAMVKRRSKKRVMQIITSCRSKKTSK